MAAALSCADVVRLASDFLDEVVGEGLRRDIDAHLGSCAKCEALISGMRDVISLAGDKRLYPTPPDFSTRLYSKLDRHLGRLRMAELPKEVPLGITPDMVPLGTHLIHFWQSQKEFESGVRFLTPSLSKNEHCIIFGHEEALERVQEVLQDFGYDPAALVASQKLTILKRHANATATIQEISAAVESALQRGANMVRFLGNLGVGKAPLPAGEDDVLELEAKADALVAQMPMIIVCMYDVSALPGKLIIQGGLQTHTHMVCPSGARENPFYPGEHPSDPRQLQ